MRVIGIINQKGGVGKTTTAVNLAGGFAFVGAKCLVVDLDFQGNVALCFGLEKSNDSYKLFATKEPVRNLISKVRDNIDIIRSDKSLYVADRDLQEEDVLFNRLKEIEGDYHFAILDCGPSFNLLNINAINAAHDIFIPMNMEYLAVEGATVVESAIKDFKNNLESIKGIIPTRFDVRNKQTLEILDLLKKRYKDKITPPIRVNVDLSKAQSFGQTIFEYNSASAGANDYADLINWYIEVSKND